MQQKKKNKSSTDMQQFLLLLTPIYNEFYKFIFSIMRNKNLTDDIVQNSLLIACQKLDMLNDTTKFKSWLFTIGKREGIRLLKSYQREVSYEPEIIETTNYVENDLEDLLIKKETQTYLLEIINALNDNYRDLILLRYYNQLSLDEIAVVLNQNPSTIRSWHMRAKQILSDKLKNEMILRK